MALRLFSRSFGSSVASTGGQVFPRRALMYVPGSSKKMMGKAPTLNVDTLCLDLEDGVASNAKSEARQLIVNALLSAEYATIRSERAVRINAVSTPFAEDDIDHILRQVVPDAIAVPKVESPEELRWVNEKVARHTNGAKVPIIAMIESANAVLNATPILSAVDNVVAVIFGADDYAADVGALRSPSSHEVLFARNHLLMQAKALRLDVIDMVLIDYKDPQRLEQESQLAFELGFTGKQVIHPNQIDVVQRCFSPQPDAIARAKKIVEANARFASEGTGAFELDNQMIDAPTVKIADKLLARARACGLVVDQ